MEIVLATKTIAAINTAIEIDQGAAYRVMLGNVIQHVGDAYSGDAFPFRSHLGASIIGNECQRQIWYSFRWAQKPKHKSQLLRLFNRGHLEEARFIAMLLVAGIQVYQQDESGKQFRISDCSGHFGGSGDGILIGVPDIPEKNLRILGELKTSGEKAFKLLVKKGCFVEKHEHYVQMQIYMGKMGLTKALYLVVNKNTDELYGEIISHREVITAEYINRAQSIIFHPSIPKRMTNNSGRYKCKWCDYWGMCFSDKVGDPNCRTCASSTIENNGEWVCSLTGEVLTKEAQLAGCIEHNAVC